MKFTEKEIELAKRLQEAGVEWKPERGDWVVFEDNTFLVSDTALASDTDRTTIFLSKFFLVPVQQNECTWLPLWHQCRKIIEETGHYLLLLTKGNNVQIDIWSFDKNRYVGVFRGETDLEVIYQALLNLYL